MALIGYARISTGEQSLEPQIMVLKEAGCRAIHEETGSGGDSSRPVLARLVREIAPGDTLVIARLDRLARSLSHLLEVIDALDARGAHFRSLGDPVETTTPQGRFGLQVLGAAAELERALIRERTKAGLRAARAAGRIGGNPGLRSRDRDAIRKNVLARDEVFMERLSESATAWVPILRRNRPQRDWATVTDMVNAALPHHAAQWSEARLKRAAQRYVREGMLEASILGRAPRQTVDDRLLSIVAAIAGREPRPTLREIAARLEELRERTPRGAAKWPLSSVKILVDRATAQGLISQT
ncbi:recombinase family protein [Paracoccus litorisediminis]|uniref:recombinase family protein n=1 Tax=Paracoccus litorisediminis TaxID=2006130 RepID=UPI00373301C7